MRIERFYHSASSAAENTIDVVRSNSQSSSAVTLIERAFPQGLELSAYALRKRLVCPRWWLIGVMSQWLVKDSDSLVSQIGIKEDDFVLSGSPLTAKTFPLIVAFWTEILSQVSSQDFKGNAVELNLGRILRGTAAELAEQREFLTSYLSSALRIQKLKMTQPKASSRRSKTNQVQTLSLSPESIGLIQIVENVVLIDSANQKLVVTFAKEPKKLFSSEIRQLIPSSILGESHSQARLSEYVGAVVTLQPDVLQAMSRSVSSKKLIPYLSLELMKSKNSSLVGDKVSDDQGVWRGRVLANKELALMHKDQLTRARSFYDHGLLSWENEAPRQRVRVLAANSRASNSSSGIVHCWRLSQHALDAIQFEQALTSFLGHNLNVESRTLEAGKHQKSSLNLPAIEAPATIKTIEACTPPKSPELERKLPSHPIREQKTNKLWSDDEFLMCVAEFYESLTPLQQQAFERERRRMSPEQFRYYVTPALLRHKVKNA